MSQLCGLSGGMEAQDSGAQLSLTIILLPPCLSQYGSGLCKVSIRLQRESVHLRANHFPSCLQSCDVFRAAKNELLQQSLEGTLEKDLAYLFFFSGGGVSRGN